MAKTIVLITEGYPYTTGPEAVFVEAELEALSAKADRVILLPSIKRSEGADLSRFKNVEVDMEWAHNPMWRHPGHRIPLAFTPTSLGALAKPPRLASFAYAISAQAFARFMRKWIKRKGLDLEDTLFYTFWFNYLTVGLTLIQDDYPLKIITRAHRYDVYEKRAPRLRERCSQRLLQVYSVSDATTQWLQSHGITGVATRWLGCHKQAPKEAVASHHRPADHKLTFLTVARVSHVKRHTLTLSLLEKLAVARPTTEVRWIVAGDGSQMDTLREKVTEATGRTPNLKVELRGMLSQDKVQALYLEQPIDWAILTSSSEGLPITICEAFSYGVPAIACDVGGVGEVVDDATGLLLPPDIEPEEFVRGLVPYLDQELRYQALSGQAYKRWSEELDADPLRKQFADEIMSL
ncbi:MAG: glycosyltransferase [Bacteroidales bacterium]|nr:glycosyltransferase [Bacteroidales bacterium]